MTEEQRTPEQELEYVAQELWVESCGKKHDQLFWTLFATRAPGVREKYLELARQEIAARRPSIPEPVTGEEELKSIEQLNKDARKALYEACKIGRLRMTIPVEEYDHDRLWDRALDASDRLLASYRKLQVAYEESCRAFLRLQTELEEARRDSKRLDYLGDYVASASNGYGEDGRPMYSDHSTHVKVYFTNHDLPLVPRTSEDYMRDAIDKAMAVEVPQ